VLWYVQLKSSINNQGESLTSVMDIPWAGGWAAHKNITFYITKVEDTLATIAPQM